MTHVAVPAQWTAAGAGAGEVADNWLVEFHDDQLTAAVIEAIAHNANLQIGAARVEVAQRYAKLAGAKLYPSVDLLAKGGGDLGGDSSGIQGAILTMNWELDLWGRVRYGRAAAAADALSVQADFEFARQSIAAQVAKAWFLAIEAGLQAEVARRAITDSESLVNLAAVRVKVGAGNEEDLYVARASVGTYRDALRDIELAREQALRSLELLIGRYPSGTAAVSPALPGQPDAAPGGLPSALLERRPDVIAAERRVAAAFNRMHEARAARLPALSLSAGISSITSDLFVLEDRENPSWSYGASLVAPIFRGGALKTQVEIRTAEQKQAVAAYADVGLRAFGEVESALAAEIAARDREKILAETLSDSQRALQVVQTQFKVGSTDLRFVTQRQLSLNATQSALVRVQTDQRVQRVNLHLALGGSFERSRRRSSSRRRRNHPRTPARGKPIRVRRSEGRTLSSCPPVLLPSALYLRSANHNRHADRPEVADHIGNLGDRGIASSQVADGGDMLGGKELHPEARRRAEFPSASNHDGQGLGILGRRANHVDPVPDQRHAGTGLEEQTPRGPGPELYDTVDVGDLDLPLRGVHRYPEDLAAQVHAARHVETEVGKDAGGVTIGKLRFLAGLAVAACRGRRHTSHEPQPPHVRR